jgi:hypothetical protein
MNSFGKFHKTPSKSRFVDLVTDALRQAGETGKLEYDRAGFALRCEGPEQRIFWLNNVYKEYCAASPEQRQALLRNFVRSWRTPDYSVPDNFEDVHPDLLPSVRSRGYFEMTVLQLRAEGHEADDSPYRPLADHLAVGLAYDLPGAILQIGRHNLDTWKVSFDDALKAACDNLRGMTKQPLLQHVPGVWMSPYGDNHDASRLVLTDWIRECEVRGDLVALVPNRDILMVTGSEDTAGLVASVAVAEKALDRPRFLSGTAVRLAGGEWVPYLPPPDHPASVAFRRLRTTDLGRDYASQGESLKLLNKKNNEDIFVADFSILRRKDSNEVTSYCVWSDRLDTLLPQTDVVFFVRITGEGEKDGAIVANAPWDRVREVAVELMQPQGLYPERYRVKSFPSNDQLAALGKMFPLQ